MKEKVKQLCRAFGGIIFRRKIFAILLVFAFVVAAFVVLSSKKVSHLEKKTWVEEKAWVFMFYDDADFSNAYDPIGAFAEEAYSHKNVDVIVLQDKENDTARMWYINENHTMELLEDMGEINMGNYTTLKNFIAYCRNNFPANRAMLWLYDHGMAWKGACIDDTNNSDHLTMDEIQKALTETGGVTFICFSAPCMMGCIESAYELRNCTEVYIGSEEMSGYNLWLGVAETVCDTWEVNPGLSNPELAKRIIEKIEENIEENAYATATMSATLSNKTTKVTLAVDKMAKEMIDGMERYYPLITVARSAAESYGGPSSAMIDLVDFARKCIFVREAAEKVEEAVSECVIAECHGSAHARSNGLSIYFPPNRLGYDENYHKCDLDFTNDTSWDEFLVEYFARF